MILAVKWKTADGKSMVPIVSGILSRGANVNLFPFIGLGSDQVEYVINRYYNVEAYHVDEHKFKDAFALRNRLLSLT